MAGSGRRVFAPGEVLTASNVMNYLQDQAVMNFAGTAARGSAIGTAVSEGMVSYLQDLDQIQVYDGSAWKQVYPSVANTGEVVQVLSTTKTDTFTTTSTSYTDVTGLSVSITPKSVSSKVLVLASVPFVSVSSTTTAGAGISVFRGSTNLVAPTSPSNRIPGISKLNVQGLNAGAQWIHPTTFQILDSPASISALSYNIKTLAFGAGVTSYINRMFDDSDTANSMRLVSTITVMEIAG